MTKLQKLRLEAGLSQSQLATAAGMSVRTLQGLESGARDINKVQLYTACRIAQALTNHGDKIVLAHDLLEITHD